MYYGKVRIWNEANGWGFIEDSDGEDFFFNISNVRKGQRIRQNADVKFDTEETQKGTEAINVSLT